MKGISPPYFLALGMAGIIAAQLTMSVDMAGWVAFSPFLIYLRKTSGWKSRLIFAATLIAGWSLCIAKIVTPPMPFAMVFLYAIPISLFQLPGFFIWDKYKDNQAAVFLFPALMTTMEWVQFTFTPLGTWGVAAYSQAHTLTMIQTVSLFGLPGLSFLVYWVNIVVAEIFSPLGKTSINWKGPAAVALLLMVFGAVRVEIGKVEGRDTIKVAAVGTDSDLSGYPLPSKESNDSVKQRLFLRTGLAAETGAKLVVWNEASTFIFPEEEPAWTDSLSALSARLKVCLIAAFIVPVSEAPLKYQNKYLFFDTSGRLVYTYNKHQPVPGEPAEKGKEPFKVFNVAGVKTGAAICYDYDFPYIARGFGKLNADLVAVPSSDWRGIDPLHTRMAAFRAVEQGHSILRSARFGLSAGITGYGEMVSQMSSFDVNDKVMITSLPAKRIKTLYAMIGDVLIYACIGFCVWFLIHALFLISRSAVND